MSDQPATRQDLSGAVRHMDEKLAGAVRHMDEKLQQNAEKLTEAIRDSQTEVLTAFYNWARPVETKLRHADELGQRLSWLEDRVAEPERKKLPPTH